MARRSFESSRDRSNGTFVARRALVLPQEKLLVEGDSTSVRHVVVWIDHHEARVVRADRRDLRAPSDHPPLHHVIRLLEETPTRATQQRFFDDVARALRDADEILVVGPSTAKLDLLRHLNKHEEMLSRRVLGVETFTPSTSGPLTTYAVGYFLVKDRMMDLLS